jgi:hypothetical protein
MIYYLAMKYLWLIIILGFVVLGFKPVRVWGAEICQYGSTQARVQKDTSDPWSQEKTINLWEGFNVGSFHNQSSQFANDTVLRVDGPDGFFSNYHNGDTVHPSKVGRYVLSVMTVGTEGEGCSEKANVNVVKKRNKRNYSDINSVYRRNDWWNSDGRGRYGEGIYTRNSWWGM